MKKLSNWLKVQKLSPLEWLWLGLPVSIWFAYQPLIHFGQDGTMNYELSVAMLYLLVVALASWRAIWQGQEKLVKSPAAWAVEVFVLISLASLFWTLNLTRGVLTIGVMGLLYLVYLGMLAKKDRLAKLAPLLAKFYLVSAVVMSILAVLQFVVGVWAEASTTLLCAGCVVEQFGFVRPNVFLIEPQFLGNALLPAVMLLVHLSVRPSSEASSEHKLSKVLGVLFLVALVMVLTLSRGALLAMLVGLAVLFALSWRQFRRWLVVGGVMLASLVVALGLQGATAMISPKVDETFWGGVGKSINQLSMGVIEVRENQSAVEVQPETEVDLEQKPHFDGYVEESTTARTKRSEMALASWRNDPVRIVFGAGLGSAGTAMHQSFPDDIGAREIVQNEYTEVLLERGLVGFISFMTVLVGVFWVSRREKWLWAIVLAFMTQWMLFSGYPNALHVYLVIAVVAVYSVAKNKAN